MFRVLFIYALSLLAGVVLPFAGSSAVHGQTVDAAEYVVYSCQHKSATEIEKLLSRLLPDDPSVHLVADPRTNRLLLRGPASAQRIAKSLLQSVDRPPDNVQPAHSSSKPVVLAHACPRGQLDHWLQVIQRMDNGQGTIKVTVARETNQLVVLALPEVHARIRSRLAMARDASSTAPGTLRRLPVAGTGDPPRPTPPGTPSPQIDRVLHVRSGQTPRLEQRIIALFSDRLEQTRRDGQNVYLLPLPGQRMLEIQFDAGRNVVLVHGPASVVKQFERLTAALDVPGRSGLRTEAVRIQRTAPSQLQKAVDAYRGESPDKTAPSRASLQDQSRNVVSSPAGAVRLVNYLFQKQPGPSGSGAGSAPADTNDQRTVPNVTGIEDLDVQTLPDLDVIILRGRNQDVEQLTKIIRELERISAETRPKIHIYHLKHTQGESIAEIVGQVQPDLVGGRQGRITVTPLTKPNALLLIGWGEAVDSIITLISKLDQPVAPESQFAVFSLRYAAVSEVQQTVQGFFASRPGLGPKVQAAVDARTNKLIVYAAPRDMEEVRRLVRQLDVPKSDAANRARIIRINNALAVDVADTLQQAIQAAGSGQAGRSAVLELMTVDESGQRILRSGMLNEVRITPDPRNNTLIVTGPSESMALIDAFIKQLDTPADRAQIKIFRIINGDAASLLMVLRSLMPSQVGQAIGPSLPSAPEETTLVPMRFSVEVRSNSIIAIGSEGDLKIVEALLTRLDESEGMNRRNAVYLLKNSPAIDVATAINEFLRSRRQLQLAAPGQTNPFQDLEREVIVVPEPVGNKLIVSATPRYFDEITQLIEKLDEPPPQVVIQILIAEVKLDDNDELGFELGLQDSVLFNRSLLGDLLTTTSSRQASDPNGILTATDEIIQAASNSPGFAFNNSPLGNSGSRQALTGSNKLGGQALSSFELGRTNNELGFGGLILSASSRNVSILIRALEESKRLNILSRPLIRTLDNQPAFIQVGQRVPRIVGSTTNTNGQSNSITLENVGLILGVTPRISPDGNVVMEIDAEKSKVGPEVDGIPVSTALDGTVIRSPRIDTVTAQATVSAADGETVVLGGMISIRRETVNRRAPYLADIPVLGHLFRFDSSIEERVELLIILTPHVIHNAEDGERIKQAEFARMNWCAADVYEMYGDLGLDLQTAITTPIEDSGDTEIIYPDMNPRGERSHDTPSGALPAPAEEPTPHPARPSRGRLKEIIPPPNQGTGNILLPPGYRTSARIPNALQTPERVVDSNRVIRQPAPPVLGAPVYPTRDGSPSSLPPDSQPWYRTKQP